MELDPRKWVGRKKKTGGGGEVTGVVPPIKPPDEPEREKAEREKAEREERRKRPPAEVARRVATRMGPQLFSLVLDDSGSMEDGEKAPQATKILRYTITTASKLNVDSTGIAKPYFLVQVVKFAETCEDVTKGMVRPEPVFTPEEVFSVRHPNARKPDGSGPLGDVTNLHAALELVYAALAAAVKNKGYREAAMPEPIVLVITDGLPNRPTDDATGRKKALETAAKIKALELPEAQRRDSSQEGRFLEYPKICVKLVAIGVGDKSKMDEGFLKSLASEAELPDGTKVPLYLYCPDETKLAAIGARIVGSRVARVLGASIEEVLFNERRESQARS